MGSPIERAAELARCDRELAEIAAREDGDRTPAYLFALGVADWQRERELILMEEQNELGSRV